MTPEAKVGTSNLSRHRQIFSGVVISDKMAKTRVVEVKRTIRHSLYHKNLIRRGHLMVHDEKNESKTGDTVLVASTSPLSRHKHFRLLKVVEKRASQ